MTINIHITIIINKNFNACPKAGPSSLGVGNASKIKNPIQYINKQNNNKIIGIITQYNIFKNILEILSPIF